MTFKDIPAANHVGYQTGMNSVRQVPKRRRSRAASVLQIFISAAPNFHAGRGDPPNAVRLGLGGATGERLDRALSTLAALARFEPAEAPRII